MKEKTTLKSNVGGAKKKLTTITMGFATVMFRKLLQYFFQMFSVKACMMNIASSGKVLRNWS